jgi:hypothetical protein
MPWLLTLRRRRGALQTVAAFSLALLLACSGDDTTGPTPDLPNGPPGGPPPPTQPPPDQPPPPDEVPVDDLVGAYVLTRVNQGTPGQLITVADPDGRVVGLYRFSEGSMLGIKPDQSWSMSLKYTDDKVNFVLEDEGDFARDDGEIQFRSAVYGDEFRGAGGEGSMAIGYDLDGNGETDLILGFARILPPGS